MRISLFIAGLLLLCPVIRAQDHTLDTLLISADRQSTFGVGADVQRLDSADLQAFRAASMAELLYQQKGLLVQQYGPGQLASPGMRGTAAAHTAVLWEGFQLQSSLNGQVDLSLFPVGFSDQVELVSGANAALWGAGAMGGTILLRQGDRWQQNWQVEAQALAGSFGFDQQSGGISYGNRKFQTSTRFFHRQSDNQFHYLTPGSQFRAQRQHAAFQQLGLMQSFRLQLNERQGLSSHTWWQSSDRQIPLRADQTDQHLRQALRWQYLGDRSLWTIRTAWMNEGLTYTDSLAKIFSQNLMRNWITEGEGNWQLGKHKLQLGLHLSQFRALSSNFDQESLIEYRPAVFGSWRWQHNRLQISTQLRQGWTGNQRDPLVPSLGLEWRLLSTLQLRFRLNRNYRVPTFNDRFWQPGGNPELLPEQGWSTEWGGDWKWKNIRFSLTAYSSFIDNWIQWVPETNYWTPQNVRNVWNRGVESRLEKQWLLWGLHWHLKLNYQFTQISSYQAESGGGIRLGLQHIFVPTHQGGMNLSLQRGAWLFQSGHTYTGQRFTASDHSASLPAHVIGYGRLAYKCEALRLHRWELSVRVDNVWNTNYQLLPGRPMPLRSYLVGLSYNWKSNSKP
jgi:vitamin B12 transporter